MGLTMENITRSFALASLVVLSIAFCAGPARSNSKPDAAAPSASAPAVQSKAEASPSTAHLLKKKVKEKARAVKAALLKVNPLRLLRDKEFKTASAQFPAFCKDWERKLHDREVNNLGHVAWTEKDGWETGTYTGYGPVQKCECHQSTDGYSIGKVTYEEFQYYLIGKTPQEAKSAQPKITDTTATTELFRWDKNKWFY